MCNVGVPGHRDVNLKMGNDMVVSSDVMKTILDGIVDVAYLIDPDGKIVYMNDSVREYGYTTEELVGTSVIKLVYAEDRDKIVQAFGKRKNGNTGTTLLNVRLQSKDGKIVPFEMKSNQITLNNGTVPSSSDDPMVGPTNRLSGSFILGTARDVSGRKLVEQALREMKDQASNSPTVSAAQSKAASTRRLSEMLAIPGRQERLSRLMAVSWATDGFESEILNNKSFKMEDKIRLTLGCAEVVMMDIFARKQVSEQQTKSVTCIAGNLLKFSTYLKELSGGVPALLDHLIGYNFELHRHCLNVGLYAAMFTTELTPKTMMMTRRQMLDTCTGALFHDMGKVLIDRQTLEQQASMSAQDRKVIQKHPYIGAKFLETARAGKEIQQVVFQHHEMFRAPDNPNIPVGANLSPFAYVTAICNVFDNLTARKPGRKNRNAYDSLVLMVKNMQGEMFLPLLKPFIRMMGGNS